MPSVRLYVTVLSAESISLHSRGYVLLLMTTESRPLNSQSEVTFSNSYWLCRGLQAEVTMGILALIGCARPAGHDMIGCLRLLDMAVILGHCMLRQIRETRSTRHVSMTP